MRTFKITLLGLTLFSVFAKADKEVLLAKVDYTNLLAHRLYTTGPLALQTGPTRVGRVSIKVFGEFCRIVPLGFEFQTADGYVYTAVPKAPGVYDLNNQKVLSIKFNFEQQYWNGVNCSFEFSTQGSGNNPSPAGLGGVATAARNLLRSTALLGAKANLNEKYAALAAPTEAYIKVLEQIERAAKKDLGTSCVALHKKGETLWDDMSSAFYTAHAEALDPSVEEIWDELRDEKLELDQAIDRIE